MALQELTYEILMRLEDVARGQPISSRLRWLRRAQWWDAEETARYRDARVAGLVDHAYRTTTFYRRTMDDAGLKPRHVRRVPDLARMPVLTRSDVCEHGDDLVSAAIPAHKLEAGRSSGSTGQPVFYVHDKDSLGAGCAAERLGWEMAGWRAGDRSALVWGNPVTVAEEWTRPGPRIKSVLFRELRIPACTIRTAEVADAALDRLERFAPLWIRGYANSIAFLAQHASRQGRTLPGCLGVLPTAEATTGSARELIAKVFGRVYDGYGASEIPGIAHECPESGLYHVMEPHVVVEFADEPLCDDGAREVIVTNLDEYGMPFIRYRIGDLAVPSERRCSCGRHWAMLSAVHGRCGDLIETPSGGALLAPDFFGVLLCRHFPTLVQYQVARTEPDRLELRAVGRPPFGETELRRMEAVLRPELGSEWRFDAVARESLPLTPGGKHRFVVDEVKAGAQARRAV